jgi:hypothetical protein
MYKQRFERIPDDNFLKTEEAKNSYRAQYMGRYQNVNSNEIFDLKCEKNCIETEAFILDLNIGDNIDYNINSNHNAEILYMLYPKFSNSEKPWLTTVVLDKRQANLLVEDIKPHLLLGTIDDFFEKYLKKVYEISKLGSFYGEREAMLYKDLISRNLSGKTVSKLKTLAEKPGGLVYEAKQLDIDMWDLLEALEGMCHLGLAKEIDESTYIVY